MLGSSGQSSNIYTDAAAASKRAPAAKKTEAAATPVTALAPMQVPVPGLPAPHLSSAAPQPAPAQNGPNLNLPTGTSLAPASSQAAAPKADLAFGLKLTPLDRTEASTPCAAVQTPPEASATAAVTNQLTQAAEPAVSRQPDDSHATASSASEVKARPATEARDEAAPIVTAAAAVSEVSGHANPFAQTTPMPAASTTPAAAGGGASVASAAEAMRTSEPAPAQPQPALPGGPAQEIAVRITRPDSPSVDVHFVERAGQVQVSVRTPDSGLQVSLRQDLGTLVSSLERSGYRTETLTAPGGTQTVTGASPSGAQGGAQNHRESSSGNGGQDSQNPGAQHNQQQRSRDQRPQKWIEELEKQS